MIRVFISYCHDKGIHSENVRKLAESLRDALQGKVEIICDVFLGKGGPNDGFPKWSQQQVEHCDKVLIACDALWRDSYECTEGDISKKGAASEAHIIRQDLYDRGSNNPKYRVVLFEFAKKNTIPKGLSSYKFFSMDVDGDRGDLEAWLLELNPAEDSANPDGASEDGGEGTVGDSESHALAAQLKLAHQRLNDDACVPFIQALRKSIQNPRATVDEILRLYFFCDLSLQEIEDRFADIVGALRSVDRHVEVSRKASERAATALFFLLAGRLIARSKAEAAEEGGLPGKMVRIPKGNKQQCLAMLCAVIHVALFGGEVDLVRVDKRGTARVPYVHEIDLRVPSNLAWHDRFWNAVYCIVLEAELRAIELMEGSRGLNDDEMRQLKKRLSRYSRFRPQEPHLALIVPFVAEDEDPQQLVRAGCAELASELHTAVFLSQNTDQLSLELVGMTQTDLQDELGFLLDELKMGQEAASSAQAGSKYQSEQTA